MVTVELPRILAQATNTDPTHDVAGATVDEALRSLFAGEPGLRGHIVDESGTIRPHVSIFVDGAQADLGTAVASHSQMRILQAVSGG